MPPKLLAIVAGFFFVVSVALTIELAQQNERPMFAEAQILVMDRNHNRVVKEIDLNEQYAFILTQHKIYYLNSTEGIMWYTTPHEIDGRFGESHRKMLRERYAPEN